MAKVYALECLTNGYAYIGVTSGKLSKRLREHRCLCRNRKHHAKKLIDDWHEFGEAAFIIKPLEDAEYSHRGAHCEAEQKWIDHYANIGKLYNEHPRSTGLGGELTAKGVEASRKSVGNRWTPEANAKRSAAQIGLPKGHGAKISATKQAKRLARESMR